MSRESDQQRAAENVEGRFYVDTACLDCALCVELAPDTFAIAPGLYAYVKKQPETPEELAAARKALTNCCVEAIFEDGAQPGLPGAKGTESKPWWRFWK